MKIKKFYEQALKELEAFFDLKLKPQVRFVNDRKEIDKFLGYKTPRWLVGWAHKGKIYILRPENYNAESIHKYSDKDYYQLIKHELAHLFFLKLSNGKAEPDWLWEGTSLFLSGQLDKKMNEYKSFLRYYKKTGPGVFKESGNAVSFLVKKYGAKKLLSLIESLKKIKSKADFKKNFEKIYGFELKYRNFR